VVKCNAITTRRTFLLTTKDNHLTKVLAAIRRLYPGSFSVTLCAGLDPKFRSALLRRIFPYGTLDRSRFPKLHSGPTGRFRRTACWHQGVA
jgi:hypothetical protein